MRTTERMWERLAVDRRRSEEEREAAFATVAFKCLEEMPVSAADLMALRRSRKRLATADRRMEEFLCSRLRGGGH